MYPHHRPVNPSVDRLDHPYIRIDVNNPPYVPQVDVPPVIFPYLTTISGLLAMRIQERAEDTPIRTVLFNIAAENRFSNALFTGMVEQCALDVYMTVRMKQKYDMFEDALEECVKNTILRTMASLYYDNPSIQSALRPSPEELSALGRAYELQKTFDQELSRMAASARGVHAQPAPGMGAQYTHSGVPMHHPYPPHHAPHMGHQPYPPQYDPYYNAPQPGYYDPNQQYPAMHHPHMAPYHTQYPGYPGAYPGFQPHYPQRHAYNPNTRHGAPNQMNAPMGGYAHTQRRPMTQHTPQGIGPEAVMTRDYSRGSEASFTNSPTHARGFGRPASGATPANQTGREPHDTYQSMPSHREPLAPAFKPRNAQPTPPPLPAREEPVNIEGKTIYENKKGRYFLHPFDGSYTWRPTLEQPYIPAWNRFVHKPMYCVYIDQDLVEITLVDIDKEDNVDYEAHKTTRVLAQERIEAAERALSEEANVTRVEEQEVLPEEVIVPAHTHQQVIDDLIHSNVDDAIVNAQVGRTRFLAENGGETEGPVVYTNNTHVLKHLVAGGLSSDKYSTVQELLKKLRVMTLGNSAIRLRELAVAWKDDPVGKLLLEKINECYTKAINDALKYRLQITNIRIDSFMDDFEPLLVAVTENYSETFASALRKAAPWVVNQAIGIEMDAQQRERAIRQTAIRYGLAKNTDTFGEAQIQELAEKIKGLGIFMLMYDVSVTLIDLTQDELGVSLPDDGSAAIFDELQPLLDKVTKRVLEDDDDGSTNLIITRDGKHLNLTTGLLDSSYHLVF